MSATVFASGSTQITNATTTDLVDTSTAGVYEPNIDWTPLAAADDVEVLVYMKFKSGGSYVLVTNVPLGLHVASDPGMKFIAYHAPYGFKLSVKANSLGASRTIDWFVSRIDPA